MRASHKGSIRRRNARKRYRDVIDTRSLLSAFAEHGINKIGSFSSRMQTRSKELIGARYHGELARDRVKEFYGIDVEPEHEAGWRIGVSDITVYSVPVDELEKAREILIREALPLLCDWLVEAEKQTYNWRRNDHNILLKYSKGRLYLAIDIPRH